MANHFEGDWRYKFVSVDNNGEVITTDMGQFHLPTVGNGGNLTNATDNDHRPLTGEIGQSGGFETLHLNRSAGPERHLRGILVFEGPVNGVPTMIVVGVHRRHPFPQKRMDSGEKDANAQVQTDGTWVATKP